MSKREGDAIVLALTELVERYTQLKGECIRSTDDVLTAREALGIAKRTLRSHRSKVARARKAGAK